MVRYNEIFSNNQKWVDKMLEADPQFLEKISKGQNPDFLFIGCSDSRVPANEIMGLLPGELFVHRNIANVIPNNDINSQAVIEYAVRYLKVKHVIVCGHYGCGGVKASMEQKDYGLLNPWLRNIRDVYREHKAELNAIEDEHARFDRLVELNVREQCINVMKIAAVQQRWIQVGDEFSVHGWVMDLKTGLLKDLDIDVQKEMHEIQEIYNLNNAPLFA